MDLQRDPIPDHWNDLVVDIQVSERAIVVASSVGDIIEIDSDYFTEEPREAIALADLIAVAPKLLAFVRGRARSGCDSSASCLAECFNAKE